MINSTTYVKTISNSQMTWLIDNKKVWFNGNEGVWFSKTNVYCFLEPSLRNPQGGWEVHK